MPTNNRQYTSNRQSIVNALTEKIAEINGTGEYLSNLYGNVEPRLKFWDEISDYPSVHLTAGNETREYLAAGIKNRFLAVTIRIYIEEEDAVEGLERIIQDIETVVEDNSVLKYTNPQGAEKCTQQISIINIDCDEGALEPKGIGEILLEVRY